MALVKFVKQHCADAGEFRIAQQTPREYAFGHKSQARAGTADILKANLIAHRFAELFPKLTGHAARRHADGQTAGFEDQNFSFDQGQQRRRNASGLARPGWSFDHQAGPVAHGLHDARKQRIDRKRGHSSTTA